MELVLSLITTYACTHCTATKNKALPTEVASKSSIGVTDVLGSLDANLRGIYSRLVQLLFVYRCKETLQKLSKYLPQLALDKLMAHVQSAPTAVTTIQDENSNVNTTNSRDNKANVNIGNLCSLMDLLFQLSVNSAWQIQLRDMNTASETLGSLGVISIYQIIHSISALNKKAYKKESNTANSVDDNMISSKVKKFTELLGQVTEELYQHSVFTSIGIHNKNLTYNEESTEDNKVSPSVEVEGIRHNLISRYLADVDHHTLPDSGSLANSINFEHIQSSIIHPVFAPSSAEMRRREDVGIGYSIAFLIASCGGKNSNQMLSYLQQLHAVIRGGIALEKSKLTGSSNMPGAMRRLSARSQLRAVIALNYLNEYFNMDDYFSPPIEVAVNGVDENRTDLSNVVFKLSELTNYLTCLAELQEIRLSCSNETLLYALGYRVNIVDYSCKLPQRFFILLTYLHNSS